MSHSYNTPPLSASHHLHFAMCTDHRKIYGHVFSKPLTFQTLQNTFSNSSWSTLVHHVKSILIEPITNLNLVLANTASAPCTHVKPTVQLLMPWSVAVSRAYRTPRRYSRAEHPQSWPRSPRSRTHTISSPIADNHQSYLTDVEFHAFLRPCAPVRANVPLAFPLTRLRLSASLRRSPSIS
jgi:hypothetical protein